ncbi:MAG: ABC transporter permease [Firmicutes bacterium]|nr:ABC transporter permease [Bacillota bacterium]
MNEVVVKDPTIKRRVIKNKTEISVISAFAILMIVFLFANPRVFLSYNAYTAVFTTLPVTIILTVSAVFMVASGEMDLSFPSIVGVSAWAFAVVTKGSGNPFLGLIISLIVGSSAGLLNGLLVTKIQLSSLVSTLGMNFLLRGLIMIGTQGLGIPLVFLKDSAFYRIFVGRVGSFPVQMIWGIVFALVVWFIFNRHRYGAHVCFIGDNLMSAREMGIKVDRVKILTFVLMGFASAFAAVLICLVNLIFWPTAGDGYLLIILAAVFLGGTPTWGGIGTIIGGIVGAFILGFLETGIIASGLTGFYTQFFYGLILILSLISHRFTGLARK